MNIQTRFLQPLKKYPVQNKAERSNAGRFENGQALVELAFTLPIVLMLMFGMMQICNWFYMKATISMMARQGSRYAALHGSACTTASQASCTATSAQIVAYVQGLAWPNIAGGTITVNPPTYPGGNNVAPNPVQVQVQYKSAYSIPLVSSHPPTMTATSEMDIIQ